MSAATTHSKTLSHIDQYPRARVQIKPIAPWVMQVPVISTSHFSQDDCDLLMEQEFCFMYDYDGRTAILIIEEPDNPEELSAEAASLIERFRSLGYKYLRLDPNGDVLEGLPTYEW